MSRYSSVLFPPFGVGESKSPIRVVMDIERDPEVEHHKAAREVCLVARGLWFKPELRWHEEAMQSTVEVFHAAIGKMEFRRLAFPVLNVRVFVDAAMFSVLVAIVAPDRINGEPLFIDFTQAYALPPVLEARWIQKLIRDQVLAALTHELNESVLVDGERIFDPHKNDLTYSFDVPLKGA